MGTRCQIDFINKTNCQDDVTGTVTKYTERARIYHHWDGNPDNIIKQLKKFIKWCNGHVGDNEFMTANFIFWCKLDLLHDHNTRTDDPSKIIDIPGLLLHRQEVDPRNDSLMSFGVCDVNDLHSDLSYFYELIVENKKDIVTSKLKFCITLQCYKMGEGHKLKKLAGLKGKLIKTEQITAQ